MFSLSNKILITVFITLLSACASNNNLREKKGVLDGGYQTNKVSDGIFYIYARTNGSITANYKAAKQMFETQAINLCGSHNIQSIKTNLQLDNSKFYPLLVTEITGFAICTDKGLSEQQINDSIKQYENS